MLIKSILLLAVATVAIARDAVLTRGLFMGKDTTQDGASLYDIFKHPKNHATATATVLHYVAENFGFTPHESSPAELNDRFNEWLKAVVKFEGFRMSGPPMKSYMKLRGGLDKLHEQFMAHIGWMPDAGTFVNEIVNLVPDTNDDRDLRDFGLTLIMIQKPDQREDDDDYDYDYDYYKPRDRRPPHHRKNFVQIRIMTLEVELETAHLTKKVTLPDQKAHISYLELEVDKSYLTDHADTLASRTKKTMTSTSHFQWVFTSPNKKRFFFDQAWPPAEEIMEEDDLSDNEQTRFGARRRYSQLLEWFQHF